MKARPVPFATAHAPRPAPAATPRSGRPWAGQVPRSRSAYEKVLDLLLLLVTTYVKQESRLTRWVEYEFVESAAISLHLKRTGAAAPNLQSLSGPMLLRNQRLRARSGLHRRHNQDGLNAIATALQHRCRLSRHRVTMLVVPVRTRPVSPTKDKQAAQRPPAGLGIGEPYPPGYEAAANGESPD